MRLSPLLVLILALFSCKQESSVFEPINYPSDNPINSEIAAFGEKLFFDKRLSKDNSISCATCHKPEFAFADTVPISVGVEGRLGFRNAPTILNVAYKKSLMLDGAVPNLEMQAIVPIQDHNEMSISMKDLVQKLSEVEEYQKLSEKLFHRKLDAFVITRALANYERTLISGRSRFDTYYFEKDSQALNKEELIGWSLFQEKGCISCHSLPHFTNHELEYSGFVPDTNDLGRFRITGDSADIGKFIVPTLRNISLTKPYYHNGEYGSLQKLITDHRPGTVTAEEAKCLEVFLNSLNDLK